MRDPDDLKGLVFFSVVALLVVGGLFGVLVGLGKLIGWMVS